MDSFAVLRKTIFCDIDGTIFRHQEDLYANITTVPVLLPGVVSHFSEWHLKDYCIILTTSRPEGCRLTTEAQLRHHGVFYHQLIMGLPYGPRLLINNQNSDDPVMAHSISLDRNKGLKGVEF